MDHQKRKLVARRVAGILIGSLAWVILAIAILWALGALWFDFTRIRWLAGLLCIMLAGGCAAMIVWLRPFWRAQLAILGVFLAILVGWFLIPPRNDRTWLPDVARTARATIEGNRVTIQNLRNFDYRSDTDFTERWETRTYDLDKLTGVNIAICSWGAKYIVHTITSWEFADGPPLAISIETRKEQGELYSALRGIYRQYELYYAVADERDVIRVRTNVRGERVYLYRVQIGKDKAREVLLDYLKEVNRLAEHPCWYNAFSHNCTTSIRHHALHVGSTNPWNWRILVNGYLEELGYERGTIDNALPFAEMKARSEITEKAKAAAAAPDFSIRIREGLPAKRDPAPILITGK